MLIWQAIIGGDLSSLTISGCGGRAWLRSFLRLMREGYRQSVPFSRKRRRSLHGTSESTPLASFFHPVWYAKASAIPTYPHKPGWGCRK